MDISLKSIVELKALAFDELVKLETAQANLKVINAEIAKKSEKETPVETPEAEKLS